MQFKNTVMEFGSPKGRRKLDATPAAPPTPEQRPPPRSRVEDLFDCVNDILAIRSDDNVSLVLGLLDRAATAEARHAAALLRQKPKRSDAPVPQKLAFYRGIDAALDALRPGA